MSDRLVSRKVKKTTTWQITLTPRQAGLLTAILEQWGANPGELYESAELAKELLGVLPEPIGLPSGSNPGPWPSLHEVPDSVLLVRATKDGEGLHVRERFLRRGRKSGAWYVVHPPSFRPSGTSELSPIGVTNNSAYFDRFEAHHAPTG